MERKNFSSGNQPLSNFYQDKFSLDPSVDPTLRQDVYLFTQAAIFVIDVSGSQEFIYVASNPTHEKLIGIKAKDLHGKTLEEVLSPPMAASMRERCHDCLSFGKSISYEEYFLIYGLKTWWSTTLKPLYAPNGQIYRLIGTSTNIDKRKETERELQLQTARERLKNSVVARIRQSLNLEHILNSTVAEVREFLQTDRVLIYCFNRGNSGVMVVEAVIPPWKSIIGKKIPDSCFTNEHIKEYEQGKIQVIENLEKSNFQACHKKLLSQFGVKASLVVPIIVGQKLWGLLIAQHCRFPRQWLPIDIEWLQDLAVQVAIAIEQAQLHQQVRHLNADLEIEVEKRTQQLKQAFNFETLIRQITEAIRDSLDEKQILQTATTKLAENLITQTCKIELYNDNHTTATVAHESSLYACVSNQKNRNVADFPELYQQLLQKQPLQFVELKPSLTPATEQISWLACPIFDDRGILGNLWLARKRENFFSRAETRLVQQIANQCAIAIRQARLYQASQLQVQELEKLNHIKDDFLKTISHELRTPMSSIQLAAQTLDILLQQGVSSSSSTFARVLDIFQQACQKQNQIVDDLLTICYIDAESETIVPENINLAEFLPSLIESFHERTQSQQQELKINIPVGLPAIKTDASLLKRIIIELLNNACKYTPAKENITVAVEQVKNHLKVTLSNTGIEIPAEEREKIFDKFYRIPNNDPWQYGGTGLGLALVQKLAELLAIDIEVSGGANLTSFSLVFPLAEN